MSGENKVVKIAVLGVGGCGCNAVKMMGEEMGKDENSIFRDSHVKVVAVNTDAQVLDQINDVEKIQLGPKLTKGQGAGGNPECGRDAAIESQVNIVSSFEGHHMVFLTAGMGGGTGTGAAPVIAGAAKKNDILTVGIVTKPFSFEGSQKMESAEAGIEELKKNVDALLVVPNDTLLEMAGDDDDTVDMFKKPNEILIYAVRSISELIIKTGTVNIDFSDVKNTMKDMGIAVIGFGTATGEHAPLNAVKDALNNPLLKNFTVKGAKRMLVYVSGNTKLKEFNEAAVYLGGLRDKSAQFKFGLFVDKNKTDVSVLIIAEAHAAELPESLKEFKKVNKDDQTSMFDEASGNVNEDVIIEVQKPLVKEEESRTAPAASASASAKPQSVNINEAKPISLEDVVLVPEKTVDQNDLNIPAVIRQEAANKEKVRQSTISEICFK